MVDRGALLAIGGYDSHLALIDANNGNVLSELNLEAGRIQAIVPMDDEDRLGVATQKGLHIVEIGRPNPIASSWTLRRTSSVLRDERIFDLAYDAPNKRVITGTLGGDLLAFGLQNGQLSPHSTKLFKLLDRDIVDDETGQPFLSASIFGLELRSTPNRGTRLFLSSLSHLVIALDLQGDSVTEAWAHGHDDSLLAMDVSADGGIVLVTDSNGRIVVLDGSTGHFKTEVLSYRIDPASYGDGATGESDLARPDILSNIGLDLHPLGQFFAVSSHDRTTKIFETMHGSALAAIVHDRMVRNVTFEPDGKVAYSYSDDGVIQRSRPFEPHETLRLLGIDRFFPTGHRRSIIAVDQNERVFIWSPDDGLSGQPVSGLPEKHSRFAPVGAGNLFALFDLKRQETIVYEVDLQGNFATAVCDGRSVDSILELTGKERILSHKQSGFSGEVLVTVQDTGNDRFSIRGADVSKCRKAVPGAFFEDQEEISYETGSLSIGVQTAPRSLGIWLADRAPPTPLEIGFEGEIISFAVGDNEQSLLALVNTATRGGDSRKLCYCALRRWTDGLSMAVGLRKRCGAATEPLSCQTVSIPREWQDVPISDVGVSSSGGRFVVRGQNAEISVLETPENALFDMTLVPISGAQNRRIKPPFAFNADETLIAVPAGDTGFNVVDTQTWEIRSSIPTPSRVYQLGFVGDEVASIDGANENAILRIQPWKPEDLIKRACDFWPQATLPRHRAGVPEPQGRQAFCQ